MLVRIMVVCLLLLVSCGSVVAPYQDVEHSIIQAEERILFSRIGTGYSEICTIKPDGTGLQIIAQSKPDLTTGGYYQARWSPDKSKIVIVGGPESTRDIWALWLMDMSGNLLKKLSNNGYNPIWKNNNEIYYHKFRTLIGSRADIYLMNIQAENETLIFQQSDSLAIQLTDVNKTADFGVGNLWNIAWNKPDSSVIASFEIGDWNNYIVLYPKDIYLSVQPKLSHNEEFLAFVKGIYQHNDIYVLELSTNTINKITYKSSEYQYLTWSPYDNYLAFSERFNTYADHDIFIIDLETNNITNITNTASAGLSSRIMDWK